MASVNILFQFIPSRYILLIIAIMFIKTDDIFWILFI